MFSIRAVPTRLGVAFAIGAAAMTLAASAQTTPPTEATKPAGPAIRGMFIPVRIAADELDANIAFYEGVFGQRSNLRFKFPQHDLEFAIVGSVALIAGSQNAQRHLPMMQVIFLVDSLQGWRDKLLTAGATVLQEPSAIPTGTNMFVRNPGGQIFEYVQIDPQKVQAVNLIKPR